MTVAVASWPKPGSGRPVVRGKFLFVGDEKLHLRGVTYGTFSAEAPGLGFPGREQAAADFRAMAANGINAVRVYTLPPRWLLDTALEHGIWVAAALSWPDHVAFLDEPGRPGAIEEQVREQVRTVGGHPALLCYVVGNEIPQEIVRWHGGRRVERFIRRLYQAAKDEAPDALVSYVNYPSTEYLELAFLDFLSFNVYVESPDQFRAYLSRLQVRADERPLVLMEIGLDSRRNGEQLQARSVAGQTRAAFESGAAGAFVFAWTDEWHRGGSEIMDWDFGLTDRARAPKPALAAVADVFASLPFGPERRWPRISVVVCSYNGAATIRDTLEGLQRLRYPDFEVIVVNDGSADRTPEIAREYDVRLISTENRGLSNARNTGAQLATGEIVAYIDDDAWPDADWLQYLAHTFARGDHACVGGPNLPPPGDGPIAEAVANAPGGPTHVLLTDEVAEHVPGCNMAFRRDLLLGIGGFDPQLRVAGDDVDICWRLQDAGHTVGFSPAAIVWHHRRNSVKRFWRQQVGYGRAEALLEAKWPGRFNAAGHYPWGGRIYGRGLTTVPGLQRARVYHGVWNVAPFQRMYADADDVWRSLPRMPEWYLLLAGVATAGALGRWSWAPLGRLLPLAVGASGLTVGSAVLGAMHAVFPSAPRDPLRRRQLRALTFALHLMQPAARLYGRLKYGLTPWRRRGPAGLAAPLPVRDDAWSEVWQEPAKYRAELLRQVASTGISAATTGAFDSTDVAVSGGLLGGAQLALTVEEHGAGRQQVRARAVPRVSRGALFAAGGLLVLARQAHRDGARVAPLAFVLGSLGLLARAAFEASLAMAGARQGIRRFRDVVTVARAAEAGNADEVGVASNDDAVTVGREGS